ncbi:MAG: AMP-binding protein [Actinomycetota bacterium]|nr:AMP-binding protein [Actinomycetota bacterium]
MFTLNDLIRWRAEQHPDLVALVDDRGDSATYGELLERTLRCAGRWTDRGVAPGEVVAVLDTNSVTNLVNVLGLSRLGAVPALLNWRLTPVENSALLELVRPVAVVAGPHLIDQLPPDLGALRVSLGVGPGGWLVDDDAAGAEIALPGLPEPADVFALAFSSGTTGQPKAIPWRHEALARSALIDGAENVAMRHGARQLMVAPIFHLAGLSNLLMGLATGAEIHLRTAFDPEAVLDEIEQLGLQYLTAVPAMFRALVLAANRRDIAPDTSSMVEMSYGASPIPPELVSEIAHLFPGCRLRQFYGMTEIGGALSTLSPEDHERAALRLSAGRVNPGFEVRIVDPQGVVLADGEPGQLMIRGASVMSGYWRDPEATAEVMVDGWFASGDIATISDGYLTIMDRAKDIINTGGENVVPAETEAVLYEHLDIIDVAIIGVPDEALGERVHAVVVPRCGATVELDAVQAHCRDRLAGFKLPRSLEVVDELPRNATGKILKTDLREPHWKGRTRNV